MKIIEKKSKVGIISSPRDWSTYQVLDWLEFYGIEYTNVNNFDFLTKKFVIQLNKDECILKVDLIQMNFSSHWLRRMPLPSNFMTYKNKNINIFISEELEKLSIYITSLLNYNSKRLGSNTQYIEPCSVNKMEVLIIAKQEGISIPDTLITNSYNEIKDFISKFDKIIIKSISDPPFIGNSYGRLKIYTRIVTENDLEVFKENAFPSLFQKYIDKIFEIRVFYIKDMFYSAAIFSQNDTQTKVDFRNYNLKRPNRIVPFKLPSNLISKLKKVVNRLGLNTASIDILVTKDYEYIFLEINPIGQFGNISYECNFGLEKIICEFLINNFK